MSGVSVGYVGECVCRGARCESVFLFCLGQFTEMTYVPKVVGRVSLSVMGVWVFATHFLVSIYGHLTFWWSVLVIYCESRDCLRSSFSSEKKCNKISY